MKPTTGAVSTEAQEFLEASRTFLKSDFAPRLIHCINQMREEDVWWRPNEKANSVGNLILHVIGNMRQWIVEGLGGIPTHRDRDGEFSAREPIPKALLIVKLEEALLEVDGVLQGIDGSQLLVRRPVQVYDVSTLQAVYHVVEHFSYHLGQILYVYKLRTGEDLGFYRDLESK